MHEAEQNRRCMGLPDMLLLLCLLCRTYDDCYGRRDKGKKGYQERRYSESGVQEGMLYVVFGDKREIIVTPDHVFLLATGKFIQAGKLKPGDQLVDESGSPVPVLTASQGRYEGGVRHISCNIDFDGRPDRHLVLSEGIVSGDYTLQLYYDALSEEWKEEGHEERLLVGSHAFF